jgi:hypothetical protein
MLRRAVTTVMLVQEVRLYRLEFRVGLGLDGGGRVERLVGVLAVRATRTLVLIGCK